MRSSTEAHSKSSSRVATGNALVLLNFPKGLVTNLVLRYVKKAVPSFSLPGKVNFKTALKRGADKTLNPVELGFADIAFLQYTGGTTGVSKGAMLSHRNMVSNVQQTVTWQGDAYEEFDAIIAITASRPDFEGLRAIMDSLSDGMRGGDNHRRPSMPEDLVAAAADAGLSSYWP